MNKKIVSDSGNKIFLVLMHNIQLIGNLLLGLEIF